MTSPLKADFEKGHVVYTPISEDLYHGFEGGFVDNVLVSIDARAQKYEVARDLMRRTLELLLERGRQRTPFVLEREVTITYQDTTTQLYRIVANVFLDPYYLPVIKQTGVNRAFSDAFSQGFA